MSNLPLNYPFGLKLGAPPYYNRHNVYRRHYPRKHHNFIDMQSLEELISALTPHIRQWGDVADKVNEELANVPSNGVIKNEDHDFYIHLDVGLFEPEELTVKVVNNDIVIEGKHEERKADDIGFVSRHFVRRYELPKGYHPEAIVSKLSSDKVLSVMLPKATVEPKERIITIQNVGPKQLLLKKNKSVQAEKTKQ